VPGKNGTMPEANPQQSAKQRIETSPGEDALALLSGLVAAVELTPLVAVRSFDRNGIVCFWNQAAARLYGVAAGDAVGQAMTRLVSYGEREQEYLDAVGEVWRRAAPLPSRDWPVTAASGNALWIYSCMFPVYRAGRLDQVFCMDVDITGRKHEEAALMPIGGNFRQLFDKSADAILLIKNDTILEINPAATRLFCCGERQRMQGQRLSDFSPLQQPSGLTSTLLEARMAEQANREGNCRFDWRYLT